MTTEQLSRLGALQRRLGHVQVLLGELVVTGYPEGGSRALSGALGMVMEAAHSMILAGDIPVDDRVNPNLLPAAPKLLAVARQVRGLWRSFICNLSSVKLEDGLDNMMLEIDAAIALAEGVPDDKA